jgi:hypothetical protein
LKAENAEENAVQLAIMFCKKKTLTMKSENPLKIYLNETKILSLLSAGRVRGEKRG